MSFDPSNPVHAPMWIPSAPAPMPQKPPMTDAMQRLAKAVDELGNVLGNLADRLEPVLTPVVPMPALSEIPSPQPQPKSDLVCSVLQRAEALEDMIARVHRVIDRVEL